MDIYKQIDDQNVLNLQKEFPEFKEKMREMYIKALSEVKDDKKEFYPFKVYRHVRNALKK